MFYMNCGKGVACGDVELVDIKIENHHGKKKPVAIWRYSQRNCMHFQESPIRFSNGRMVFNSGRENIVNIVPSHLAKKYSHMLAK